MYKAKINIGDYKKGDTVPDEKAIVWKDMYVESPVEEVNMSAKEMKEEAKANKEAEAKAKKEAVDKAKKDANEEKTDGDKTPEGSSDVMLDDYMGRNENVVKKNIERDNLPKETLNKLLIIEKEDKNRKKVIDAIKHKLEVI